MDGDPSDPSLRRGQPQRAGAALLCPGEPGGTVPVRRGGPGKKAPPGDRPGGGPAGRGAGAGGSGAVQQPGADQRDPGQGAAAALGPGLFGGYPLWAVLPAVGALFLSGEPGPGGAALWPCPGAGGAHRGGDGAGSLLRHRHHHPGHGPAGQAGHRGGGGAGGGGGRQGERGAQWDFQRGVPLRRCRPGGCTAGPAGPAAGGDLRGPTPEGDLGTGDRRHRDHGAGAGGVCVL